MNPEIISVKCKTCQGIGWSLDPAQKTCTCQKPNLYMEDELVSAAVDHPSHYTFGKIEVIDALEDWGLDFHLANTVKYIVRSGRKDPAKLIEDLEKAAWYLARKIALLKETKQ